MPKKVSHIIKGEIFLINQTTKISSEKINDKIIIAESLDVKLLPILLPSKCIIVESGGYLSHFAIFCRESGILFKIIKNITKQVKHGQIIELNLDDNKIKIIS